MYNPSIRSRLLFAFTGFALLVIILGVNFTYSLVRKVLYTELDHFLRDKINYQQIAATQIDDRIIFRLSEPILDKLQDPTGKDFFQFRYADDGREIFKSSFLPVGGNLPNIGIEESDYNIGHDAVIRMIKPTNESANLDVSPIEESVPIRCMGIVFEAEQLNISEDAEDNRVLPIKIHLVVAHNCSEIESVLTKLKHNVFLVGIILSILVLIVVTIIVTKSMKPVGLISNEIRDVEIDKSDKLLDISKTPKELYPVVNRVNELVTRVREAIQNERNFTSNAAHELRNPLAALRTQLEVELNNPSLDEESCETLSNILNLQNHMERVVTSLLLLARLDSGSEEVSFVDIPLSSFIKKTWKPFFDRAFQKNVKLSWDMAESDISILNDPILFGILLSNLFDNAVSHIPEKGKLDIKSIVSNNGVKIVISNTNPGVTASDINFIVTRFGRKNANFNESSGHSGIGFNICERIVKGHLGGEMAVEVDNEWFTVILEFPVEVIMGNHYHV